MSNSNNQGDNIPTLKGVIAHWLHNRITKLEDPSPSSSFSLIKETKDKVITCVGDECSSLSSVYSFYSAKRAAKKAKRNAEFNSFFNEELNKK